MSLTLGSDSKSSSREPLKTWSLPEGGVREAEGTQHEMGLLFAQLPQELSEHIQGLFPPERLVYLNEIYLQLGQQPECIFHQDGESTRVAILDRACTRAEIDIFSGFFQENEGVALSKRRGISGTLHRVSLITKPSSRPEKVLGVTVRVGRALQGLLDTMAGGMAFLQPLAKSRRSLLLIGKPGVGKTTALREIAWLLSQDPHLRVVVVDKSLEIAGDADTPHAAIGKSRWMPVGVPRRQHEIMLEAVENQSPDVVLVDEISNSEEVKAAMTIAQRGVMLIATVHGTTLAELLQDRERAALVGGTTTVTLSGHEAERRADKKKQVLKRMREPVFSAALELHAQSAWIYHDDVTQVVDDFLDKQPGTAIVLQPGRATQAVSFPRQGQLEYCTQCRGVEPAEQCTNHRAEAQQEQATNNRPAINQFFGNNTNSKRNKKGSRQHRSHNHTIR